MNGVFNNNIEANHPGHMCVGDTNAVNKKRKLESLQYQPEVTGSVMRGRSFLPIRGGCDVFCTEDWKATGTSLFYPVRNDLFVNMSKYDQISATQGSFHTSDDAGNFQRSLVGHVLHLWRFDKSCRKLYIAQSFLFTNNQGGNIQYGVPQKGVPPPTFLTVNRVPRCTDIPTNVVIPYEH